MVCVLIAQLFFLLYLCCVDRSKAYAWPSKCNSWTFMTHTHARWGGGTPLRPHSTKELCIHVACLKFKIYFKEGHPVYFYPKYQIITFQQAGRQSCSATMPPVAVAVAHNHIHIVLQQLPFVRVFSCTQSVSQSVNCMDERCSLTCSVII